MQSTELESGSTKNNNESPESRTAPLRPVALYPHHFLFMPTACNNVALDFFSKPSSLASVGGDTLGPVAVRSGSLEKTAIQQNSTESQADETTPPLRIRSSTMQEEALSYLPANMLSYSWFPVMSLDSYTHFSNQQLQELGMSNNNYDSMHMGQNSNNNMPLMALPKLQNFQQHQQTFSVPPPLPENDAIATVANTGTSRKTKNGEKQLSDEKMTGNTTPKKAPGTICMWTPEEHKQFLRGLEKFGKGDWRNIAAYFVPTRSPQQVASHAQKYFLRLDRIRKRKSVFDVKLTEEELRDITPHQHGAVGRKRALDMISCDGGRNCKAILISSSIDHHSRYLEPLRTSSSSSSLQPSPTDTMVATPSSYSDDIINYNVDQWRKIGPKHSRF